MDINYLLAREQVELALARTSSLPAARASHQSLADRYRDMVADYRHAAGADGTFSVRVGSAVTAR